MYKNQVTAELLVNGNPITEYSKNNKIYVEGRKGSKYTLKIHNGTSSSILAVATVDGLSVMDGKPGNIRKSGGYILSPYRTINIDGWRTSLETTRAFEFSDNKSSYSNKTGQGRKNIGVIGLACFYEVPKVTVNTVWQQWPTYNYNWSDTIPIGGTQSRGLTKGSSETLSDEVVAVAAAASIGTAMGEEQQSNVVEANFDRQGSPFATFVFYYHDRRKLKQLGIIPHTNYNATPNPFPQNSKFCREV